MDELDLDVEDAWGVYVCLNIGGSVAPISGRAVVVAGPNVYPLPAP
jgi:hypothetical protein